MRPRVGHIQFLNCLPLYHMLVKSGAVLALDLFKDTPIALSRRLFSGELDISPIPAIEYARHADEVLLLPDLTVSSRGKVKSILLVSAVPAERLDRRPVALANVSATSQVLVQILLRERYRVRPQYFECPQDLPEMLREADAALLIGDAALRVWARKPRGLYVYDLGAEWTQLTGEAMVYAVWAVREEYARNHPDRVKAVVRAFKSSMASSLRSIDSLAKDISRWEPFSERFLKSYFKTLRYEFGEPYQRGLKCFYRMAQALGAIERVPELRFVITNNQSAEY
ncbi:MAG: menaquinone biosynthesis protein [Desulfobacterota bacterium]|nr:menaquinone biosynthesis protein [Thermodesulfobacteriota bacterium]